MLVLFFGGFDGTEGFTGMKWLQVMVEVCVWKDLLVVGVQGIVLLRF